MRERLSRSQYVIVRPLNPQEPDEFGDASIVMPDNRLGSFRLRAQISITTGKVFDNGRIGRSDDNRANCMVRRRDIPPDAPADWEPNGNDIFEISEGKKMFVVDVQPAFPARISIRRPDGGYDGWRVHLSDRQPTLSVASQYE